MTTTTYKSEYQKRVERLRMFMFDRFDDNKEDVIDMKKDSVFTKALDGIKKGWEGFKTNQTVLATVDKVGSGLGTAYRAVKGFVKRNWKNAALATATTLAAGAVSGGFVWTTLLGAAFYASIKTISYYKRGTHADSVAVMGEYYAQFLVGMALSMAVSATVLYVVPFIIIGLAEALNLLATGWVYSLFMIFA